MSSILCKIAIVRKLQAIGGGGYSLTQIRNTMKQEGFSHVDIIRAVESLLQEGRLKEDYISGYSEVHGDWDEILYYLAS